jgi:hypothetical protein
VNDYEQWFSNFFDLWHSKASKNLTIKSLKIAAMLQA